MMNNNIKAKRGARDLLKPPSLLNFFLKALVPCHYHAAILDELIRQKRKGKSWLIAYCLCFWKYLPMFGQSFPLRMRTFREQSVEIWKFHLTCLGMVIAIICFGRVNDDKNNDAGRYDSISWIANLLDEECSRHLIDLRKHWDYESRNLWIWKRLWILWYETRVFELQALWAMGVTKVEKRLGMHQLS